MVTLKKNNFTDYTISIIEPWIKYLETIRGFGTHTLNAYKRDVLDFLKFCNNEKHNFLAPNKQVIREYLFNLSERKLSRPTVARRISSLKNFFKFLLKDKGMTLKGVKKVLNSEDSDIDELYNNTINQKYLIKSKLNKIKNILTTIKNKNG